MTESEEKFSDSIAPQPIRESYYIRFSVRSRIKSGIDKIFEMMTRPLMGYDETPCEGCSIKLGRQVYHAQLISDIAGAVPAVCVNQANLEEERRRKNAHNF